MISDEELRRAAQEWEEARLKRLPEPEDCRFEASPGFERKMRRLIERTDRPAAYWLKRSGACLLLIVLLGGSVLTLSSRARAAFFGWTMEVFDSFFEYRYTGENAPAPENVVYRPAWIPDGFAVDEEVHTHNGAEVYYENTEGQLILFAYSMYNEGTAIQIDGDNIEVQSVHVGNYSADLYIDRDEGENSALVWADTERKTLFQILAPLSGDELVKMAESVTDVARSQVVYLPSWTPVGVEVYRESYWEAGVHIAYLCGGERLAHFSYFMNDEGVDMHIVGGDPELRRVRVGKYPADLYLDRVEGENNSLVWFDGERSALFAISAPAGGEELIRMAESVTDVERPKEEPG